MSVHDAADIVITQDFFPKIGGAHYFLYEVYRRWPAPVLLLTRPYEDSPQESAAQAEFDCRSHGSLRIVREDMAIGEIDFLKSSSRRRIGAVVRHVLTLAAGRPVTLHCLRAFPEGLVGLLSKLRRPLSTRLVVYAHGEEVLVARSSRQLKFIASLVYRFADLVIANSRSTEALVRGLAPRAVVACLHPGVDAAAYVCPRNEIEAFRAQWGWPPETIVASTISRMETRKNQSAVIAAVAALRKEEGLPLAYVCAGDGEERPRLVELATALGVAPWVRFPGAVSEKEKVLTFAASDIHVMPSIRVGEMIEGFGIVFLEAAAAGVPSICGNIGGQPEAVLDGETGLVVDGTDPVSVRRAILRLAADAPMRARMGQAAQARARELDWNKVAAAVSSAVARGAG